MKNIIKKLFKNEAVGNIVVLLSVIGLLYMLIAFYFVRHFFFNTVINGVDVSLKAHADAEDIIAGYVKDYELQLIERDGEIEKIKGQDMGLRYNKKNSIYKIYPVQKPVKWISSLIKSQSYYVSNLFFYDRELLANTINELHCLNKDIVEPENVGFRYSNGSYELIAEVYGNKINKEKLSEAVIMSVLRGNTKLDLNEKLCYENPKYTLTSDKALQTRKLLNRCVSTKITYVFRGKKEILDGDTINKWLAVDENLGVAINEKAVKKYVQGLGSKYDTAGAARKFKASTGEVVEVKGGFYGWKLAPEAETKALLEHIKLGEVLEKEPIYAQKPFSTAEDEIGGTYVEINITRQHLWFYKDGKLITQGAVVTGNPNRGNSTWAGTYMLNYKQKGSVLRGANYEAKVTYWMPFNGNIGIHDASWRRSFGGNIYKTNGTHGCVNVPFYLAKIIFENIEEGTPVICYEE